jgi:hypothetical protein
LYLGPADVVNDQLNITATFLSKNGNDVLFVALYRFSINQFLSLSLKFYKLILLFFLIEHYQGRQIMAIGLFHLSSHHSKKVVLAIFYFRPCHE